MAWFSSKSTRYVFLILSLLAAAWGWERCDASGTFGFDVHHVFSDVVKGMLGIDGSLPDKNSLEYYKVLAHRDRLIRGRRLASNNEQTPVTFSRGNRTLEIGLLGFLHYANVSVGTPAKWFLVALDTGSDLFWLPCDCGTTCVNDLKERLGRSIPLNFYSPNASTTSSRVTCSDAQCFQADQCGSPTSTCPYQIRYLSNATSSNGVLVEDVLHLITEDATQGPVDANITLGCGQNQTGIFQTRAAVNGLFGLGLEDYAVPSILAKAGIASNSFSMCFGGVSGIVGRISFGDKGSSDQTETQLLRTRTNPTYIVNVTQLSVGGDAVNAEFFALFDSGTAFTQLLEPEYDALTKNFNSLVNGTRRPRDPSFPFEFCYDLSPNATTILYPAIHLIMEGEAKLTLRNPLFIVDLEGGDAMYCLAVMKSNFNVSIIGQNFMSGYRIVFDRERMVLGWKESDCFGDSSISTPESPPPPRRVFSPPSIPLPPTQPPVPPINPNTSSIRPINKGFSLSFNPLTSALLLVLPILAFF